MRLLPSPIELTFPAEHRFIEAAQLVGASVARACGLPLEEGEDFRLLIDEICEAMVDSSRGASVHVVFRMVENRLIVEAATEAGPQPEPDRLALGDEILAVLADRHERVVEGGQLRYTASRDLRSGGVG